VPYFFIGNFRPDLIMLASRVLWSGSKDSRVQGVEWNITDEVQRLPDLSNPNLVKSEPNRPVGEWPLQ